MARSRYLDRVALVVTVIMLVITILFMNGAALGLSVMGQTVGYAERLFDRSQVHHIDIVMDDWDDLIAHATQETYYVACAVIDGESFRNVGIRAKGNTSLSTVASLGSERYSFKIEFDHYDKSKSYYGLDKLSLNNLIQDATMMKDYLTYTMMQAFGVASSLCSYVYMTVNGEDWGLYLAVEGVEDAFLQRNYGKDPGMLYKPDSTDLGGGRGNGQDFSSTDLPQGGMDGALSDGTFPSTTPGDMPSLGDGDLAGGTFSPGGGWGEGGGMGQSDVKLQYVDDALSSYTNIWDNAKTDLTVADQRRLIASLKTLSENGDIAAVVDVEQVIRYFVVHNFVCNGDSYTGSMVHNYYLYEKDGKLAMIPWDYNLAFGTFQAGDATSTINTPIDAPVEGGTGEDRPLWYWIVANEAYTTLYHQYFAQFLQEVDAVALIDEAYALIQGYVAQDPTAFYTYAEFETGVETLRQFCTLRKESISLQLENGETATRQTYVDASALDLSTMGSMGATGAPGGDGTRPTMPGGDTSAPGMPTGNEAAAMAVTEDGDALCVLPLATGDTDSTPPSGASPGQMPGGGMDFPSGMPGQGNRGDMEGMTPPDGFGGNGADIPGAGDGNMVTPPGNGVALSDGAIAWIWVALSAAVLAIGLLVVKKYRW